jgi:multidrug efflux pump
MAAVLQADPAVADVSTILGGNNNNGAVGNQSTLFVDLKPLGDGPNDRHEPGQAVVDRLDKYYKTVTDLDVTLTTVQFISGGGPGGGAKGQYAFQLTSTAGLPLQQPTLHLAQVMRGMKQFRDVSTSFDSIGRQELLQVDRNAASRLHVSMGQIDSALYDAFGQNQISTIYSDINQYRVVLTADAEQSLSPANLLNTYVRNSQGRMIPLSALASIQPHIAPVTINHYNQLDSAPI